MSKFIKRTPNMTQYNITPITKSGYPLGFEQALSGTIGRWYLASHAVMQGDRVSLGNSLKTQFQPLAVQMTSQVEVLQKNYYIRLRYIYGDDDMQDMLSMDTRELKENTAFPQVNLQKIVSVVFPVSRMSYSDFFMSDTDIAQLESFALAADALANLCDILSAYTPYYEDFWADKKADILTYFAAFDGNMPSSVDERKEVLIQALWIYLHDLAGSDSFLAQHGYPYVLRSDLHLAYDKMQSTAPDFHLAFSTLNMWDAPLRAWYATWFENFRNSTIERKSKLPNYHRWTLSGLSNADLLNCLIPRYLPWQDDYMTTMSPDDISRHVFAVIFDGSASSSTKWDKNNGPLVATKTNGLNAVLSNLTAQSVPTPAFQSLPEGLEQRSFTYRNPDTLEQTTLSLPVPNKFGQSVDQQATSSFSTYLCLELNELRAASAVERWLKAVFAGGDEYTDYSKSVYGVDLPEVITQRPEYISEVSGMCNVTETMSNVDTDQSVMGEKRAVMSAGSDGDGATCYCPEFGIVLNVMGMRPEAHYFNPLNPTLLTHAFVDLPNPRLASGRDELSINAEFGAPTFADDDTSAFKFFGHSTPYHLWKGRLNCCLGDFTQDKAFYLSTRFFGKQAERFVSQYGSAYDFTLEPMLNASLIHCRPTLQMFIDSNSWTSKWFGFWKHDFYVERGLPVTTETI